jgi:hypothetical protein
MRSSLGQHTRPEAGRLSAPAIAVVLTVALGGALNLPSARRRARSSAHFSQAFRSAYDFHRCGQFVGVGHAISEVVAVRLATAAG